MATRRAEFDLVLDQWPAGPQDAALQSLVDSGEVTAVRLPRGFVGLQIHHTQTLIYIEAGRPHVRQVLTEPRGAGAPVPPRERSLTPWQPPRSRSARPRS